MNYYTMLLLWGLVGVFSGILVFLAVPILAGPSLPRAHQEKIADWYVKLSAKTIERIVLVRRKIGRGFTLAASSYDAEKEAEKVKLDGEAHYFMDPMNLMGHLHKKPFGLAVEGTNVIIDPFLAEVGERERERELEDRQIVYDENGNPQPNRLMQLPGARKLVELKTNAPYMVPGTGESKDAETTESLYEKSQRLFGEETTKDVMVLIVAYAVGAGVVALAIKYGSSGGGGGPSVSIPTMILPGVFW